ncbi:MAG: hypothetical protein ABI408_12850 [Gemmatimonadaceae bacterium]
MARAYTVATAALALGIPPKWLDNVLSHHRIAGVVQERQGIPRKLSIDGLMVLALTVFMIEELELSTARAIKIAQEFLKNAGAYESPMGLRLSLDLPAFRATLLERLENAVEIAPAPRRGRPATNKTGRLD